MLFVISRIVTYIIQLYVIFPGNRGLLVFYLVNNFLPGCILHATQNFLFLLHHLNLSPL